MITNLNDIIALFTCIGVIAVIIYYASKNDDDTPPPGCANRKHLRIIEMFKNQNQPFAA